MNPNQQQLQASLQKILDLHSNAFARADSDAIAYWGDSSDSMLVMAGLAIAALFALLALRKGEDNKPRFLEIPICGFLAVASIGFLVCSVSLSAIAESLLLAKQNALGDPGPQGVYNIGRCFYIAQTAGFLAITTLFGAIALSGFLRNFLLGIGTVAAAAIGFLYLLAASYLPIALFG